MTNEERKIRVENFAEQFGCEIHWGPIGSPGMMFVEFEPPMIECPEIDGQIAYMVCLHELGHVIHGHTQGRPPFEHKRFYFDNGVLHSEAQAWNWAMDVVCEDELDIATADYMWHQCLDSYRQGALTAGGRPTRLTNGDRGYVEFVYDDADDYFWGVKDRMYILVNGTVHTAYDHTISFDPQTISATTFDDFLASYRSSSGVAWRSPIVYGG